jgi:deoxyribonuclease-4
MSREIQGVQPCLDFAHLHARPGDGSMNTYDEWARSLEQYGQVLGDGALRELHIHLSGIEYSSKGEKNHLALEEADLDLEALFRALRDFKTQGRILCESPVLEDDALKMKQMWAKIVSSDGEEK